VQWRTKATIAGETPATKEIDTSKSGYQAYQILHLGFTVVPIVAGVDKFLNLMVSWDQYLLPFVNNMTGGNACGLM